MGNVVKYCMRHEHKGKLDDLKKALEYLCDEISLRTKEGVAPAGLPATLAIKLLREVGVAEQTANMRAVFSYLAEALDVSTPNKVSCLGLAANYLVDYARERYGSGV